MAETVPSAETLDSTVNNDCEDAPSNSRALDARQQRLGAYYIIILQFRLGYVMHHVAADGLSPAVVNTNDTLID